MSKVAVIGYGIEGKVSAKYFADKGYEITICDAKEEIDLPAQYKQKLGPDHLKNLESYDIIVRTAGIHPNKIKDANPQFPKILRHVTTSLNEFLSICPSKNIIGITGTKGKGTTSTLVYMILNKAGKKVHLGGNIGIAPLQMLEGIRSGDWVVLELSSFQLMDIKYAIPTAVCVAIYPEHLNWHKDMPEYLNAKTNLFRLQRSNDIAIYNAHSPESKRIASSGAARLQGYDVPPAGIEPTDTNAAYVRGDNIYYKDTVIMSTDDVAMPGRHNLENLCAAITVVWPIINGDISIIKSVASTFTGLAHHMEYVTTINKVDYYNDSYSTMPDATIAAISSITKPTVLILGGYDKKLPFDNMINAISKVNIRHIILIGSLSKTLKSMLEKVGVTNITESQNDMKSIINNAQKYAKEGDIVLLSPGCAAKGDGYFIDNVDRGNQFKQTVLALQ